MLPHPIVIAQFLFSGLRWSSAADFHSLTFAFVCQPRAMALGISLQIPQSWHQQGPWLELASWTRPMAAVLAAPMDFMTAKQLAGSLSDSSRAAPLNSPHLTALKLPAKLPSQQCCQPMAVAGPHQVMEFPSTANPLRVGRVNQCHIFWVSSEHFVPPTSRVYRACSQRIARFQLCVCPATVS